MSTHCRRIVNLFVNLMANIEPRTLLPLGDLPPDRRIWRSGEPQPVDLTVASISGVTRVISLIEPSDAERAACAHLGLTLHVFPLSGFWAPSDEQVATILPIIMRGGSLVHCKHGHERTGLMMCLVLICNGWTAKDALAYTEKIGMSWVVELTMKRFVRDWKPERLMRNQWNIAALK